MFITTANSLSGIPVPLQDRMEIIQLSGYTEFEKLNIALKYLVVRQKKECGLDEIPFNLTENAVRTIIHHYTKEAGVRNLEREFATVCRKIARDVVAKKTPVQVAIEGVPQPGWKITPKRLPRGNYLFLGAVPKLEGVKAGEPIKNAPLIWWDETHPVLRYVALEYVYVGEALTITVPKEAQVLVEGTQGPALCRYSDGGRNCLILSFAIENSTWWSKQGFPIFAYNAIRYLGGTAGGEETLARPGDSLRVPLPAGETQAMLVRPDGGQVRLTADTSGTAYFGGTERAGVYRVERGGLPGQDRFTVNLEDDWESDVGPSAAPLTVEGGQPIKEVSAIRTSTPEIWRWCIGVALVLVVLEWWVYNRRVMV